MRARAWAVPVLIVLAARAGAEILAERVHESFQARSPHESRLALGVVEWDGAMTAGELLNEADREGLESRLAGIEKETGNVRLAPAVGGASTVVHTIPNVAIGPERGLLGVLTILLVGHGASRILAALRTRTGRARRSKPFP